MAKKRKKKKSLEAHPIALGSDLFLLLLTRFSEKSKARSERKYSRKRKHKNRSDD